MNIHLLQIFKAISVGGTDLSLGSWFLVHLPSWSDKYSYHRFSRCIPSSKPMSSNHPMKTRMILAGVNQAEHQSLLLPHMIEKYRSSLINKPSRNKGNRPLVRFSFIGRDDHRKKPHGDGMKTCGSLKTIQEFLQQQCVVVVATSGGGACHDPPLHYL